MSALDPLEDLARVEPPVELDALVQRRMLAVVEAQAQRKPQGMQVPAVALPGAERCVYAAGLALYGTQALGLMVRVVWRAFAG